MIDVFQLRKGITFTLDGEIYKVIEFQHYKPGRGKAIILHGYSDQQLLLQLSALLRPPVPASA